MAAPMRSALPALLSTFSRLSLGGLKTSRCVHTQVYPLLFRTSSQVWAAPMKKKKKADSATIIARETKRKKKFERQIKRLEKYGRQLKPIEEIVGDALIKADIESRRREKTVMTFEDSECRALLTKDWTRYCMTRHQHELTAIRAAMKSQQRALDSLREESEELYQKAIQIDEMLLPLEMKGPVETPPIKDYDPVDGDYLDTTKRYDR
ncbi:large ribosomal subunit protein mL40-like [Haliotis cracherodii]|uniref:large ribosomal subunit protein mL40-like n=1 Tax=Haliotis cracherodii TaxID=6455 RepID=UPI0039EBA27A